MESKMAPISHALPGARDRSLRHGTDGTGRAGAAPSTRHAPRRNARWPPGRKSSTWAGSGSWRPTEDLPESGRSGGERRRLDAEGSSSQGYHCAAKPTAQVLVVGLHDLAIGDDHVVHILLQ